VPALAAVMTTVLVAVFGMCMAAGLNESTRMNWNYTMPLGNVRASLVEVTIDPESGAPVTSTYDRPDAVENAIRASVDVERIQPIASVSEWAPGAPAPESVAHTGFPNVDIPAANLCPSDQLSPEYSEAVNDPTTPEGRAAQKDWRCRDIFPSMFGPSFDHLFVSDAGGLELALGHEPSVEAKRVLAAGGAVSLYRQYVEDDRLSLSWFTPEQIDRLHGGQRPGSPQRMETLDAIVELPEHPGYFGVFVTKATADRLGLDYRDTAILASTTTIPDTRQLDALQQAITNLPGNEGAIYANVETGPPDYGTVWAWGLLGLAGLIAIASSAVAIGLARFDGRQDDATLSALGAGRLVRKSSAFWQAVIIAGIGSILGAATGLVPAWALGATGLPFVPPWLQIGLVVVALPLVIASGSWLLATRNKVSARRVAIA
jgi:putative ABC transport system permease protein